MKKILFIILCPFLLYAQDTTLTKYSYMASALLYGVAGGISEGYRVEYEYPGKVPDSRENLNKKWQTWRYVSAPFIVGTGFSIALHSKMDLKKTIISAYTSAVISWISHDMAYNMTRRLDPFRKAITPAITEVQFPVKLVFLGSAILLEILFN